LLELNTAVNEMKSEISTRLTKIDFDISSAITNIRQESKALLSE
jgi:hypothetical protein